jgi:DNA polymerase I
MSKKQLEFSGSKDITEEKVKVRLLSDLKMHDVYKYTVPSSDWIAQINKSLNKAKFGKGQATDYVFENHIQYMDRILIDMPDYFLKYPNTDDLTFFAFDIETLRENYVDKKKIISIAYSYYDGITWQDIQSSQSVDEKELLEWFLSAMENTDPDVLVGYYHRGFDIPRIIDRCKANRLDYNRLGREKGTKYWINRRFNDTNVIVPGRVLYDLLDSVMSDQTLYGLKNKKMKTICEHFGIEGSEWVKEAMSEQTVDISQNVLKAHNEDDIKRTIGLWNVYWNNIITQAELFNIPLNMVAEGASQTLVANLFLGRGLFHQGIMSDGSNMDRHPEIFKRDREKGEGAYEAAKVGIYLPGFHEKVWKIDFSGFYPSIMAAFNLSPDTCKIVKYLPYEKEFRSEVVGTTTKYYIPDRNINKVIVIAVRNDKDGFLRTELRKIRKKRDVIKRQYRDASDEEKNQLDSMQYCLKVLQNIPSGKNGEATARYGAIPVSIATVGFAREIMEDLDKYLNKDGQIVIETDTDGDYTTIKPDLDDINVFLTNLIADKFNLKESAEISLDLDEYGAGYFIKMKNYVLMNLNGEMTFHGVSMKSSRHPGIFVKARDILAKALLNKEEDIKCVINDILKMEQYTLDDFTMRNTLHKRLSEYGDGSLQRKIGNQMKAKGIPVEIDTQIEYIKGKNNWIIAPNATVTDINRDYYYKVVEKLCTALGFENEYKTRQMKTLGTWI